MTVDRLAGVTCLVMAGGKATRFGSDKLSHEIDGVRLIDRVLARLSPWFAETIVVHAPGPDLDGLDPAIRQVPDLKAGGGPLVGLVSGLAAVRTPWVFAVAADMPLVRRELVDLMWARTAEADVIIPLSDRGPEPLCALYRTSVLPKARDAVDRGERRVISFFGEVRVLEVEPSVVRSVDPGLTSFFNINTVADVRRIPVSPKES